MTFEQFWKEFFPPNANIATVEEAWIQYQSRGTVPGSKGTPLRSNLETAGDRPGSSIPATDPPPTKTYSTLNTPTVPPGQKPDLTVPAKKPAPNLGGDLIDPELGRPKLGIKQPSPGTGTTTPHLGIHGEPATIKSPDPGTIPENQPKVRPTGTTPSGAVITSHHQTPFEGPSLDQPSSKIRGKLGTAPEPKINLGEETLDDLQRQMGPDPTPNKPANPVKSHPDINVADKPKPVQDTIAKLRESAAPSTKRPTPQEILHKIKRREGSRPITQPDHLKHPTLQEPVNPKTGLRITERPPITPPAGHTPTTTAPAPQAPSTPARPSPKPSLNQSGLFKPFSQFSGQFSSAPFGVQKEMAKSVMDHTGLRMSQISGPSSLAQAQREMLRANNFHPRNVEHIVELSRTHTVNVPHGNQGGQFISEFDIIDNSDVNNPKQARVTVDQFSSAPPSSEIKGKVGSRGSSREFTNRPSARPAPKVPSLQNVTVKNAHVKLANAMTDVARSNPSGLRALGMKYPSMRGIMAKVLSPLKKAGGKLPIKSIGAGAGISFLLGGMDQPLEAAQSGQGIHAGLETVEELGAYTWPGLITAIVGDWAEEEGIIDPRMMPAEALAELERLHQHASDSEHRQSEQKRQREWVNRPQNPVGGVAQDRIIKEFARINRLKREIIQDIYDREGVNANYAEKGTYPELDALNEEYARWGNIFTDGSEEQRERELRDEQLQRSSEESYQRNVEAYEVELEDEARREELNQDIQNVLSSLKDAADTMRDPEELQRETEDMFYHALIKAGYSEQEAADEVWNEFRAGK